MYPVNRCDCKIARLYVANEDRTAKLRAGDGEGERRVKKKEIYIVTEITRSKELTTNYELQRTPVSTRELSVGT